MRVSYRNDVVEVDLRKTLRGGSAVIIHRSATTEVSFGNLHVQVCLRDIGLEVTMDPEPDSEFQVWKSEAYARERAWLAVQAALTPLAFFEVLEAARAAGREVGRDEARAQIREALGVR